MQQQFLLNADGSWPSGTSQYTIDFLIANNIPLVRPTPRWTPQPGFMLEEQDAMQDEAGIWRQTWVEVPVPEPDPVPTVTGYQFTRSFTFDELTALRDLVLQSADTHGCIDALMSNGYVAPVTI
jgi:hypothetical protein